MLLQRAVRHEALAFSPGVSGRLAEAYRRLGYEEITNYWLICLLNPVRTMWQFAMRTAVKDGTRNPRLYPHVPRIPRNLRFTVAPDERLMARLADALAAQNSDTDATRVDWTPDLLKWRYFSPTGPAHLLIEDPAGGWAIVSLGVRSRVTMARLLEYVPGSDPRFMTAILSTIRGMGAGVALAYSTRAEFRDQLLAGGWRLRRAAPSSFAKGSARLSFTGGAGDLGFEALSTRFAR